MGLNRWEVSSKFRKKSASMEGKRCESEADNQRYATSTASLVAPIHVIAITLKGLPEPLTILRGAAITIAPVGGN